MLDLALWKASFEKKSTVLHSQVGQRELTKINQVKSDLVNFMISVSNFT